MNDKAQTEALRRPLSAGWKLILLCLLSAGGNLLLNWLVYLAGLPLFLDTFFTVAVTFCAGLWAGLGTLLVYQAIFAFCGIVLRAVPPDTVLTLLCFLPCAVVEILLVAAFRARNRRTEAAFLQDKSPASFAVMAVPLLLLAAIDCVALSTAGGIIEWILYMVSLSREAYLTRISVDTIEFSLARGGIPFPLAAILARIPVNTVDRLIVMFGGFGLSLLYRKFRES